MSLREAAQQALEALEKLDEQELETGDIVWLGKEIGDLRAALAEEKNENTVQSTGGVHSWVSDGANCGVEAVTDCHEKAADHVPDAKKMMASVREDRTVEPVAYLTGYYNGRPLVRQLDETLLLPVGTPFYAAPIKHNQTGEPS